jgi:hypothetical protein
VICPSKLPRKLSREVFGEYRSKETDIKEKLPMVFSILFPPFGRKSLEARLIRTPSDSLKANFTEVFGEYRSKETDIKEKLVS